jgi:hypothetical protein
MVVFQIDINGFPIHPTKCDPPVSARIDRITALVPPNESMKTKTGQVHIFWARCVVECTQYVGYPSRVLHAEPAPVSGSEKALQGPASERPDHRLDVSQYLTICQALAYIAIASNPLAASIRLIGQCVGIDSYVVRLRIDREPLGGHHIKAVYDRFCDAVHSVHYAPIRRQDDRERHIGLVNQARVLGDASTCRNLA